MFTNAKYLNSLSLTDSNTYPQVKALLLDELGLINFTPLMPPDSLAEINNNVQTRLKLKFELLDLSNAAILYAIAQREGRQIGVGEFTGEAVINALMKHMNFAIQNKREVALEICRSWQNVARTIMENTAHKSTKPAPGLFSRIFGKPASPDAPQALLPIAQFGDWLNKIASCSLQAFFEEVNARKARNEKQNSGWELFITDRLPEEKDMQDNTVYLFINHAQHVQYGWKANTKCEWFELSSGFSDFTRHFSKVTIAVVNFRKLKSIPVPGYPGYTMAQALVAAGQIVEPNTLRFERLLFGILSTKHPAMCFPCKDVLISAHQSFPSLLSYLHLLSGNYFGQRLARPNYVINRLSQLQNYLDIYFTDKTAQSAMDMLINKEIQYIGGSWITTALQFLEFEFNSLPEKPNTLPGSKIELFSMDEVNKAFDELLKNPGKISDKALAEYFENATKLLLGNKQAVRATVMRDLDTSLDETQIYSGIRYAFLSAVKNLGLSIRPEARLGFQTEQTNYDYDLSGRLKNLLFPFNINCEKSDLFEHMMCRLAGIEEFPQHCQFSPLRNNQSDFDFHHDFFQLAMSLSSDNMRKLEAFLNKTYGAGTAQYIDLAVSSELPHYLKINLSTMGTAILPDWYTTAVSYLAIKPRSLKAYQTLCQSKVITLATITESMRALATELGSPEASAFIGNLLLKAFNVEKPIEKLEMLQRTNTEDAVLDLDLLLPISHEDAQKLILQINMEFPQAMAMIVRSNLDLPSKYDTLVQQIRIDKETFISKDFQMRLKNGPKNEKAPEFEPEIEEERRGCSLEWNFFSRNQPKTSGTTTTSVKNPML